MQDIASASVGVGWSPGPWLQVTVTVASHLWVRGVRCLRVVPDHHRTPGRCEVRDPNGFALGVIDPRGAKTIPVGVVGGVKEQHLGGKSLRGLRTRGKKDIRGS